MGRKKICGRLKMDPKNPLSDAEVHLFFLNLVLC